MDGSRVWLAVVDTPRRMRRWMSVRMMMMMMMGERLCVTLCLFGAEFVKVR